MSDFEKIFAHELRDRRVTQVQLSWYLLAIAIVVAGVAICL